MSALPRLFLHFFDLHFLEAASRNNDPANIESELRLATRLAILVADEVIVPAASYFESPLCARILNELSPLFPTGIIRLVGSSPNVHAFIHSKLATYDEGGRQHNAYTAASVSEDLFPPFKLRRRSATRDITEAWLDRSESPTFLQDQFGSHSPTLPRGFVDDWRAVPDALAGRAFTPEYATQHLAHGPLTFDITTRVHAFINDEYFRSFSEEFAAGFITDLVVLSSPHDLNDRYGNVRFSEAQRGLREARLLEKVNTCDGETLVALRDSQEIVMALLPSTTGTTQTSRVHGTQKLDVQVDLAPAVKALREVQLGPNSASVYQRQVTAILDQVFSQNLLNGELEYPINSGRKRIDIKWVNLARDGAFAWFATHYRAPIILGECKNYSSDLGNPEVDQLAGRFAPHRSQVGFLLCRKVADRKLLTERCRDVAKAQHGLILVLDDDNIEDLASMNHAGGWKGPQVPYLMKLVDDVIN